MTKSKEIRVGLVGAAGTGKSSLAEALSAELGIPALKSREITKAILDRDGYDYGSGVQVERFLASSARQMEILQRTIKTQPAKGSFVADRTVIDLAAYAVIELHNDDLNLLRKIFYACKKQVSVYTHLFLCPWRDIPIKNNHQRTLNPWYQFQIHALDEGIMADWGLEFTVLKSDKTSKRVKEVLAVVGKP